MGNAKEIRGAGRTVRLARGLASVVAIVGAALLLPVAAQAADGLSNQNTNNTSISGQTLAFGANGQSALPKSVTIYLWTNGASGGFLNLSNRTINVDIKLNNSAYVRNGGSCGSGSTQSGYTFRASYTYSGGASFRSCSIVLQLQAGTAVGTYDTTLTYASVGSGSANITGKVTKTQGAAATITGPNSETGSSAYGQVAIGDSSSKTFTIENTGTSDIAGDPTLSGSSSYSITSENCANPLPLFATCQATVKFLPTAEQGTENATLSLSGSGASASIALTASGLQPIADLDLDLSSYDFGDTPVGYPLTKTFTVSNVGNTTLALDFQFSGSTDTTVFTKTGASTCGASLAVGLTCTYVIQFSPQAGGGAAYSGSFSVSGSTTLLPNPTVGSVSLTGLRSASLVESYGVYDQAGTAEKYSHSFGAVNLGSNSSYTFTVKNLGNVAITGLSTSIGGSGAARFGRTTTCASTLPRNASCTVTVTFTPSRTFTVYGSLDLAATNGGSKAVGLMGSGAGIAILNDQNDNLSETNHRRWADVIGAGGASQFGGDNMRAGFEVELGADQDISSVQISNTLTTNDSAPGAGTFASVADLTGGSVSVQRRPGSSQAFISAGVPLSSIVGTGIGSYGFSNGTNLILTCIGGTGTTNDRRVWFRIVNDDGQVSTATGSILRLTNVNYGCPNGGPYISSQRILQVDGANQPSGTMNAIAAKGDAIKLQFNTNNRPAPITGGDPGFVDAVNWRLRNSRTGAMLRWDGSAYIDCAAPCTGAIDGNSSRYNFASRNTGTQQMDIVAPNQRGRWVVEAAPQGAGEDDRRFFHVGSILVNDFADPDLTFGGSLGPRPDTDTGYTISASLSDPGDSAYGGVGQVIEWDLNDNRTDGPAGDGFEFIGEGTSSGNPPAEALSRAFDTTGKTPGPYTIRARVTDNGAVTAADDSARQKIFEYTTTINSLPVATTEDVYFEADDPQGSNVVFRATDVNGDPFRVTISPAGGNDGSLAGDLAAGIGQNTKPYSWPSDYTGDDAFPFTATDDKRGTGPTGTLRVRVRPNTTIDGSGVLGGGNLNTAPPLLNSDLSDPAKRFLGSTVATGAEFDFSSPQQPVVDYECRLLRDNPIGYTGDWANATVVEEWTGCESINPSATAATGGQGYADLEDGLYRFEVRAVNAVDVVDGTPAFRTWRVDNTAPVAEVRVGPTSNRPTFQPRYSNQVEPTYTLRASDAERSPQIRNSFECRVLFGTLSGQWKSCGSPSDALGSSQFPLLGADPGFGLNSPFAEGSYQMEFRSTDEVGNLGSPLAETLIIDVTAPDTALAAGPEGLVNSRTVGGYVLASTQANSTFECEVTGQTAGTVVPVAACPNSSTPDGANPEFTVPSDGFYTFRSWAIDPATNRDPSPLEIQIEVDDTDPTTTANGQVDFGGGPTLARRTQSRSITATFTGADTRQLKGIECRIDSATEADWKPCQSPERFGGLSDGPHRLEIRSRDEAGNVDATPEVIEWVVDRTPPVTTITQAPDPASNDTAPEFRFTTNEEVQTSTCRLDGLQPVANCTSPITAAQLGATGPLADGPHTFTVRSTDIAGNAETTGALASWNQDTTVPEVEMLGVPPAFTPLGAVDFGWLVWDGAPVAVSPEAFSECDFDGLGWVECERAWTVSFDDNSNGPHTFKVRARDAAGNVSTVMERSWTVLGEVPVAPTITGSVPGNGAITRLTGASISFQHPLEGTGALDGLFCQLDNGAPFRCESNVSPDGLADGEHVFRVSARDIFGNLGAPATVSWTVASTAPITTISSGPSGLTRQRSARLTFTSDRPGTFECRVDDAPWAACVSPFNLTDLTDGPHSLRVRAVTLASPVGVKDPTPPIRRWTVDATAPTVQIDDAPVGSSEETSATVAFSSDDPAAFFQCRVGSAPYDSCASPVELTDLAVGEVTFSVRAIDSAGNLSTPAEATWSVTAPTCPEGYQGTPPNCTEIPPVVGPTVVGTLTEGTLGLAALGEVPLPADQITLTGVRAEDGRFLVPKDGIVFLPIEQTLDAPGIGSITVRILITAINDGTGVLPNGGGAASLTLPVQAEVEALLGGTPLPLGDECALRPVIFDLAGTYDEEGQTVSLGSETVSFPTLTGCGTFKALVEAQLGLPRNDISIQTTFALEEQEPDPVRLTRPTVQAPRSIKAGRTFQLGTRVRNIGSVDATDVKVCLRSPGALVRGAASRCQTVRRIAAGDSETIRFPVATRNGKEGQRASFQISVEYFSNGTKTKELKGHVTLLK